MDNLNFVLRDTTSFNQSCRRNLRVSYIQINEPIQPPLKNPKKSIQIQNAPSPVGSYSQAVLSGDILYISGQISINPYTSELNLGTIESQTKQVMDNIVALLDAANLTTKNLVKCSIFLTNMNDFTAVDKIYASYFKENFPARETVQVSALPKGVNVEISAIATLNI